MTTITVLRNTAAYAVGRRSGVDPAYTLGYKASVPKQRYHDWRAGMLDPWECVVFFQDLIEAEVVPPRCVEIAVYYVSQGLCYHDARMAQ